MFNENQAKAAMQAGLDHFKGELKGMRTGRANPAILDGVRVEVYGTHMKIKEMATVTVPEARQLLITPFDPSNSAAIGKAIENANLNIRPVVDGNVVRINIPPMDGNARKEMVKLCKKKGEEGKVTIREIRRKLNDEVKKEKSSGLITEDVQKSNEKKIQDLTDKFCKEIDLACSQKEKEILEI